MAVLSSGNSAAAAGCRALGRLAVVPALLLAVQAAASQRLPLALAEPSSPHWTTGPSAHDTMVPPDGHVAVLGEISLGQEGLSGPTCLQLRLPDGSTRPLRIDRDSVVLEFGRLVYCRFSVDVPETVAAGSALAIEYGDDVNSPNLLVSSIRIDPSRPALYREITAPPPDREPDPQEHTLTVIADRQAGRYRLLYLLPVAVLLAAVFLRKKRPGRTA